ncbi:MAG: acyl-CoA reductase [Flavobacteriaceae bacterium]|nr:acyl-CoA reductase [Flavobacteriaceae bacterium]
MELENRIDAFVALGEFLKQFSTKGISRNLNVPFNNEFFERFEEEINTVQFHNGWFTKDNILFSLEQWAENLNKTALGEWLKSYDFPLPGEKTIALITAGNIPLVGFHDFLSVLISGQNVLVKQSSSDKSILPLISDYLIAIHPEFNNRIRFSEEKLNGFDAVIATGSNNTARYFETILGKYPHIIRRNRNSVAVLRGDETKEELFHLGQDIFQYFGLGCRSVSKLMVPRGYDFNPFFEAIFPYHTLMELKKYENNYTYNKAVYLMSEYKLLENGFLMLKEDTSYSSPIASLFYEYYDSAEALEKKLSDDLDNIQCVIGKVNESFIPFGQSQCPKLDDFADGVDTLRFISGL